MIILVLDLLLASTTRGVDGASEETVVIAPVAKFNGIPTSVVNYYSFGMIIITASSKISLRL